MVGVGSEPVSTAAFGTTYTATSRCRGTTSTASSIIRSTMPTWLLTSSRRIIKCRGSSSPTSSSTRPPSKTWTWTSSWCQPRPRNNSQPDTRPNERQSSTTTSSSSYSQTSWYSQAQAIIIATIATGGRLISRCGASMARRSCPHLSVDWLLARISIRRIMHHHLNSRVYRKARVGIDGCAIRMVNGSGVL